MRTILSILCCSLILAARVHADDDDPHISKNDKGEVVWALTDYLHGTTAEVRELLNKDVDRLRGGIADAQQNIAELKSDIVKEKQHGLDQVRASEKYRELTDEMNQADLERKTSDGQDKLDASSRFNKARFALQKLEDDAAALGSSYLDDQKNLASAQKELVGHQAALEQAKKWRGQLVAAIRSTFELEAPLHIGSHGLISSIKVVGATDDAVLGQFDAIVSDSAVDAGTAEGIQTKYAEAQRVTLMLHGSYSAKSGKTLALDRSFEVVKRVEDPQIGMVYVVKPIDSEVDRLLEGMPTDEYVPPTTRPSR